MGPVNLYTKFDVSFEQCFVSDRYSACAVLIEHMKLSDDEVNSDLLPQQPNVLSYCGTTVSNSGSGSVSDKFKL